MTCPFATPTTVMTRGLGVPKRLAHKREEANRRARCPTQIWKTICTSSDHVKPAVVKRISRTSLAEHVHPHRRPYRCWLFIMGKLGLMEPDLLARLPTYTAVNPRCTNDSRIVQWRSGELCLRYPPAGDLNQAYPCYGDPLSAAITDLNRCAVDPIALADQRLRDLKYTGTAFPDSGNDWLDSPPNILSVRVERREHGWLILSHGARPTTTTAAASATASTDQEPLSGLR